MYLFLLDLTTPFQMVLVKLPIKYPSKCIISKVVISCTLCRSEVVEVKAFMIQIHLYCGCINTITHALIVLIPFMPDDQLDKSRLDLSYLRKQRWNEALILKIFEGEL